MPLRSLLASGCLLALASPAAAQAPGPAPLTIRNHTDGVNSQRMFTVAAFCRGPATCAGRAKVTKAGKTLAQAPYRAAVKTTFKTRMRLKAPAFRSLRKVHGKRMKATLTLTQADGRAFSHLITIHL